MTSDQDLDGIADAAFEQFFLVNPAKINLLIEAAGIVSTDNVVELGAGAGTVARQLPPTKSLTVVELDERLIRRLGAAVPHARIIQADALTIIRELPCDVLISNLPTRITEELFTIIPSLPCRTAVLAVDEDSDLSGLESQFTLSEITPITGSDFRPPQRGVSRIVRLARN